MPFQLYLYLYNGNHFIMISVGGSETYWWFGVLMLVAAVLNWFLLVLTRFQDQEDEASKEGCYKT
jgi:hypothetical protein